MIQLMMSDEGRSKLSILAKEIEWGARSLAKVVQQNITHEEIERRLTEIRAGCDAIEARVGGVKP